MFHLFVNVFFFFFSYKNAPQELWTLKKRKKKLHEAALYCFLDFICLRPYDKNLTRVTNIVWAV